MFNVDILPLITFYCPLAQYILEKHNTGAALGVHWNLCCWVKIPPVGHDGQLFALTDHLIICLTCWAHCVCLIPKPGCYVFRETNRKAPFTPFTLITSLVWAPYVCGQFVCGQTFFSVCSSRGSFCHNSGEVYIKGLWVWNYILGVFWIWSYKTVLNAWKYKI